MALPAPPDCDICMRQWSFKRAITLNQHGSPTKTRPARLRPSEIHSIKFASPGTPSPCNQSPCNQSPCNQSPGIQPPNTQPGARQVYLHAGDALSGGMGEATVWSSKVGSDDAGPSLAVEGIGCRRDCLSTRLPVGSFGCLSPWPPDRAAKAAGPAGSLARP